MHSALFNFDMILLLQTDVTVPLFQKALRKDIDVNIVKLLQTVLPDCDSREHEEKDVVSHLSEMFGLNYFLLKVNSHNMIH